MSEYYTLYIIGNGFDLAHGLQTSYNDFKMWLENSNEALLDEIDLYFAPPTGDFWTDVETSLGRVREEYAETTFDENDPRNNESAHYSYSEMEEDDDPNALSDCVADAFRQEIGAWLENFLRELARWINEHPRPSLMYKGLFNENSLFLSFNYTHTLLSYEVQKSSIAYIHGEIGQDNLIMGHSGRDPSITQTTDPDTYSTDKDTPANALGYIENGVDALIEYFNDSTKQTDRHIQEHYSFFESLSAIQDIYILGHSLNDIDQPYFQKISEMTKKNNPTWHVVYFIAKNSKENAQEEEKARICSFLQDINVDSSNIDLIESSNFYKETILLNNAN